MTKPTIAELEQILQSGGPQSIEIQPNGTVVEKPRDLPPVADLQEWQSYKRVLAGQITEIVAAGCYVRNKDGSAMLRLFDPDMTARYKPAVGDFWVVYPPDHYQSISPHAQFVTGYIQTDAVPPEPATLESAIQHAINRFSAENGSDTPDFLLADYLMDCLRSWDRITRSREQWHGRGRPDELPGAAAAATHG